MDFHTDDEFEIAMVGVDLNTGTSTPINQLTPQQLNRLIVVPENLVPALLEHMKRAGITHIPRNTPQYPIFGPGTA